MILTHLRCEARTFLALTVCPAYFHQREQSPEIPNRYPSAQRLRIIRNENLTVPTAMAPPVLSNPQNLPRFRARRMLRSAGIPVSLLAVSQPKVFAVPDGTCNRNSLHYRRESLRVHPSSRLATARSGLIRPP
jgi:hypothetical protein